MLTRAEHAKLMELLDTFRRAAIHLEGMIEVGSHMQESHARQQRSLAWDNVELYLTEIGPSPYEHPMLKKQQNDGLREKQGR